MTAYDQLLSRLKTQRNTWLVTGVAGFIGSNLLETLLKLNQRVVGLDNFATGYQRNLDEVQSLVSAQQWANFQFIKGDIRNLEDCRRAMTFDLFVAPKLSVALKLSGAPKLSLRARPAIHGSRIKSGMTADSSLRGAEGDAAIHAPIPVDYVLHQAALGSVPRSVEDPITTNATNISGFLNMLVAARDAKVKRFVYAASSSTYGDHPGLPKVEDTIGKPLSPYAVTKYVNELYADVFAKTYGLQSIGLRYFNVFGPRQDPNGAYAAVIPKWIASMIQGEPIYINGDGETSRDFCYVANAVQANLLAATSVIASEARQSMPPSPIDQVYNVAVGDRTTLNELYEQLKVRLQSQYPHLQDARPLYRDFRAGDVRHSLADISKAAMHLGYAPTERIGAGLELAMPWYLKI